MISKQYKLKDMKTAYIKAISYYLPENQLTNKDLCALFPNVSEEEIFYKSGVKTRHIASQEQTALELGIASAKTLFQEYDISPNEIDFLIFCTECYEFPAPAASCVMQDLLKIPKSAGAMDIHLGCSGFVYGLSVAKALILSEQASNILFITSEIETRVLHPNDLNLRMIFGDGSAATLISGKQNTNTPLIGQTIFGTDGAGHKHLQVPQSGFRNPITKEWLETYQDVGGMPNGKMVMNGQEILIFTLKVVPTLVNNLLEKAGLNVNQIDKFVFHQANAYLLEVLRKKMAIPKEKYIIHLENIGNTVSSTIPIALKEALKTGQIKPGERCLIAGFGIGFSWAGAIIYL